MPPIDLQDKSIGRFPNEKRRTLAANWLSDWSTNFWPEIKHRLVVGRTIFCAHSVAPKHLFRVLLVPGNGTFPIKLTKTFPIEPINFVLTTNLFFLSYLCQGSLHSCLFRFIQYRLLFWNLTAVLRLVLSGGFSSIM